MKTGPLDQPAVNRRGDMLSRFAMELALGDEQVHQHSVLPLVAATSLLYLTRAIVQVAAFNSDPHAILEHVVTLLRTADVEKVAEQLRKDASR